MIGKKVLDNLKEISRNNAFLEKFDNVSPENTAAYWYHLGETDYQKGISYNIYQFLEKHYHHTYSYITSCFAWMQYSLGNLDKSGWWIDADTLTTWVLNSGWDRCPSELKTYLDTKFETQSHEEREQTRASILEWINIGYDNYSILLDVYKKYNV